MSLARGAAQCSCCRRIIFSSLQNSSKQYPPGKHTSRIGGFPLRHFTDSSRVSDNRETTSSTHLDDLYDDITKAPPPASTSTSTSTPSSAREEVEAKARVVFGSRLAGPAERRRELDASSRRIAGVLVPPRPEEPDNCCMSGCVNCVWDRYRDELEEWAAKSAEARGRLEARKAEESEKANASAQRQKEEITRDMPTHVASSMDDDGGGSEALWSSGDDNFMIASGKKADDILQGVPIGIREFIKNEKRLKEKKAAAAAAAAPA